jgi:hypothetical protein
VYIAGTEIFKIGRLVLFTGKRRGRRNSWHEGVMEEKRSGTYCGPYQVLDNYLDQNMVV